VTTRRASTQGSKSSPPVPGSPVQQPTGSGARRQAGLRSPTNGVSAANGGKSQGWKPANKSPSPTSSEASLSLSIASSASSSAAKTARSTRVNIRTSSGYKFSKLDTKPPASAETRFAPKIGQVRVIPTSSAPPQEATGKLSHPLRGAINGSVSMLSQTSRPSARLAAQQVSKNAAEVGSKKMNGSPVIGSRRTSPNGGLTPSQGETTKTTSATTRSRLQNRKQNSTEPVAPAALPGSGGQGQAAKEQTVTSEKFALIPSCSSGGQGQAAKERTVTSEKFALIPSDSSGGQGQAAKERTVTSEKFALIPSGSSGGQGQAAKERTATREKFALIPSGTQGASSAGMGASLKKISSGGPEEPLLNQEAIAQHGLPTLPRAPAEPRSPPVLADSDKTAPAVAVVASFPVRTLTAAKPPITEQPSKPSLDVPDTGGPAAAGLPVTSSAAATVAAQQPPGLALVGSPPLQVMRMGQPTSNGKLPANGGLQFSGKTAQTPAATSGAVHQRVGLPVTNGGPKVAEKNLSFLDLLLL
jgi:hypothetical protein